MDIERIDQIIDAHGASQSSLIQVLLEIQHENPPFVLKTQRRMLQQPGLFKPEILQVRAVLAKRAVKAPDDVTLFFASQATLLALPAVQALADELPRLASKLTVEARNGSLFVVFSVFAPTLEHRQIVV